MPRRRSWLLRSPVTFWDRWFVDVPMGRHDPILKEFILEKYGDRFWGYFCEVYPCDYGISWIRPSELEEVHRKYETYTHVG